MDSALTPREIQSRIRAGESLEDVARAAGVPTGDIEGYAAPVLAEREHMAALAQSAQVRRATGPSTPISLDESIVPRLENRGVDPASVLWDAWREEDRADRHWTVRLSYQSGSAGHEALFDFDPRGRSVSPVNSDAQKLVGEPQEHKRPAPRPRTKTDPDTEPTVDLNDELALVRAVQDDETPIIAGGSALAELYAAAAANHTGRRPRNSPTDNLRETDGIYDIVPNPPSDMDVLYDMLSGFDEDSVHVYSGLERPVHLGGEPSADIADTPTATGEPPAEDHDESAGAPRSTQRASTQAATQPAGPPAGSNAPEPPEQDALGPKETTHHPETLKNPTSPAPAAGKKSPRRRRAHRASVPTWDEIMFGGPRPESSGEPPHDKQ
ncbi:Protein of unknown function [Propionibacterium cyclohexanicum]|uniref:DUF3071 domain-containing protein n=1 Tax=Propionibacterium cyclohexanicum TaxID=64702 RepID=A0A1H9QRA4_9ACTN|nr:septation protein SepH [Propionibacterium cyclohexanicum]SER62273.1 Protein of unknown function [Propionibacterium cyclohexanicum]